MSIDKALAILRERTPGRWVAVGPPWGRKGTTASVALIDEWEVRSIGKGATPASDPADARAIVLAVNTIEAALAVASAARVVCDPMVEDGGGDRWWSAHDALRESLAALDAAIEEATA